MSLERLTKRFTNKYKEEVERRKIREAAIATRSALRFAAFEANPDAVRSAFRVVKDSPRGPIMIVVNPGSPTIATWIQEDRSQDYKETKRYQIGIAENGDMTATTTTLERRMKEDSIPVVDPFSITIGPFYLATGRYAHIDTGVYDRLEKGESNFNKRPQSFNPTIAYLDGLRRDILRAPAQEMEYAAPVIISGDLSRGQIINFPSNPLERTG